MWTQMLILIIMEMQYCFIILHNRQKYDEDDRKKQL